MENSRGQTVEGQTYERERSQKKRRRKQERANPGQPLLDGRTREARMRKKLKAEETLEGPLYRIDQADDQDFNRAESTEGPSHRIDQVEEGDDQDFNPAECSEGPSHHIDQVEKGDYPDSNPAEILEGPPCHFGQVGNASVCTRTVDFAALTRGIELSENAPVVQWPGGFTTCVPFIVRAEDPSRNVLALVTIYHIPLFSV